MTTLRLSALGLALSAGLAAPAQAAVLTPYFNDFTGANGSTPTDFTVGTTTTGATSAATAFNIQNNALRYTASQSATGGGGQFSGFARVEVDGSDPVANGGNFVVSSTVTPGSVSLSGGNKAFLVGLAALGTSNFGSTDAINGTAADPYYWALMSLGNTGTGSTAGTLQLRRADGATTAVLSSGTFAGAIDTSTPLTFTLEGTYTGAGLTLDFTVSDGTVTSTPVTLTDPTPLTGDFFGYRTRLTGGSTSSVGVDFDNFSIIPEPSSALAILAGCGALVMRRRTRQEV